MCILKGGPLKAILLIKESNDLNAAFPIFTLLEDFMLQSFEISSSGTFSRLFLSLFVLGLYVCAF